VVVTGSVATEERQRLILERARDAGSVSLVDTAGEFGVHEMTIRRDFDLLESRGLGRRVRGAFLPTMRTDFQSRLASHIKAKRAIARKLLPLVPAGGGVSFDASTTIHQLAKILQTDLPLTALTNSTVTFDELQGRPRLTAILTGGESEPENFALSGPFAVRALEGMRVERAFMSSSALDAAGHTGESTVREAQLKFTALANAEYSVLALDSSKIGERADAAGPALSAYDLLVTELDPAHPRLDPYRELLEIH
jgi:DeoR family fructose operon transcriptional repressor